MDDPDDVDAGIFESDLQGQRSALFGERVASNARVEHRVCIDNVASIDVCQTLHQGSIEQGEALLPSFHVRDGVADNFGRILVAPGPKLSLQETLARRIQKLG